MTMEHFVDRRSPFLRPRVCQYIQSCRVWAKEKSFATASVPMHSPTYNCEVRGSNIVWAIFFEEIGPVGPVTCTMNAKLYASLLRSQIIPTLQQRACLDKTILM